MARPETCVTFGLDNTLFALPVAAVVEILDTREIASLPRAPGHLLGLIDRRGASVPVVDLRRLMGRGDRTDTPETRIVVLALPGDAGHSVGLRVDRVIEVTALDDAGSAPLAEADLLRWREHMIAGIGRRNGSFVTVLDVAGLFAAELSDLPANAARPAEDA
ncbi:chemotaxis protein CheW [Roseivivax sediminis]|uniref:Purine-binding chemotaxis protein CheW n=1 Tax=Roseivivax sediminis TaxID=936889 RepID=A0A1I1UNS9_9RHOB|nr:chemotaxis protein CheW [Roseivivax sediminis]SFD72481.1 purine-binding chemotaxis protein CheW [Roseivivax sediminis]